MLTDSPIISGQLLRHERPLGAASLCLILRPLFEERIALRACIWWTFWPGFEHPYQLMSERTLRAEFTLACDC